MVGLLGEYRLPLLNIFNKFFQFFCGFLVFYFFSRNFKYRYRFFITYFFHFGEGPFTTNLSFGTEERDFLELTKGEKLDWISYLRIGEEPSLMGKTKFDLIDQQNQKKKGLL